MTAKANSSLITTAKILGYAGLIPFVSVLLALFLIDEDETLFIFSEVIVVYSAIILTFVSAVHWGCVLKLADNNISSRFVIISVIPSIIAWVLAATPPMIALAGFFISFIVWQKYEENNQQILRFPDWYQLLRKHLSYSVAGIILLIWLVLLGRQV